MGVPRHPLTLALLVALALLGSIPQARADEDPAATLARGDAFLSAEMYPQAARAYERVRLLDDRLALSLLARAETYERWGRLGKASRIYGRFLEHPGTELPRGILHFLETRRDWLAWNHASFRSKRWLRSGTTLLIGGVVVGGLGAFSHVRGVRLFATAKEAADLNGAIGGIVLQGLGIAALSVGGILGLVALGRLIWGGVLRGRSRLEPPRPGALPEAPAWRKLLSKTALPPLSPPPLLRVPATEAPLSPPPIQVLDR